MRIDYPDLERLHARARRERAEMVWRLLIAPVIRFFQREPKRPAMALRSRAA
jgi:hypothetical protein